MDFELAEKIEDIIDGDHTMLTNNDHTLTTSTNNAPSTSTAHTLSTSTEKSPFIENKPHKPYPKILDNKYFAPLIGLTVVLLLVLIVILVVMFSDDNTSQTNLAKLN